MATLINDLKVVEDVEDKIPENCRDCEHFHRHWALGMGSVNVCGLHTYDTMYELPEKGRHERCPLEWIK